MGNDDGYLDVFVNGILGTYQAPEETVPLESGMIGCFGREDDQTR